MRKLNYELKQLCLANREGSYGTQRGRERTLTLIANQLDALGFKKMYARSLRPKHVERLVAVWTNGPWLNDGRDGRGPEIFTNAANVY